MSLINQMLRDLDARRGPASRVEAAALQGMGLADGQAGGQHTTLQRAGWAIGLILISILLQQGYQVWSERRANQVAVTPVVTSLPVISQQPAVHTQQAPATPAVALTTEMLPAPAQAQEHEMHSAPAPTTTIVQAPVKIAPPQAVKKPLSPAQKAQRRFNRAQTLLTADRFRAAADELLEALELDPKLDEARLQLATLYLHQRRTDRARQLLETGHQIDPDNAGISIFYARLLADQGEYRHALEILNISLRQGEVGADTLALAASLHYKMKQFTASVSHYREALARHPEQGVWWMGLGVSLEHNQQPTEALAAYRRASKTSLDSALQNFVTGRIAALSGRTD